MPSKNGQVKYSKASQIDREKDAQIHIEIAPSKETRSCCEKCAFCSCWLGFIAIIMGMVCAFAMKPIVEGQILSNFPLFEGGLMFEGWKNPQVEPVSYIYMFNLTNEEAFLQGLEKPNLVELGPYAYKQKIKKTHTEFTTSGSIRYKEYRFFAFDPSLSNGSETDSVIVPNIPLFGAMLKMKEESQFAKESFKYILQGYEFAKDLKPFLKLTVQEFIWGYDSLIFSLGRIDSLNCKDSSMDTNFGEVNSWDEFKEWDFDYQDKMEDVEQREVAPVDCDITPKNLDKFGIFSVRNHSSNDPREVNTGGANLTERGLMISWHDRRRLDYWGDKPERCNIISSSRDPSLLPLNLQKTDVIPLFIGDLGRTLFFKYSHEVKIKSFKAYRYVPEENTFDNPMDTPANLCFCVRKYGECLPTGMMDLSTAFEGSPILMSWPHFLYGNPELRYAVKGMNPDSSKHVFYFDIEPNYGITLAALAKFQMNVEILKNSGFGYFDNIIEDTLYLPFAWLEEGISEPTPEMAGQVNMLLALPTKMRNLLAMVCAGVGVLLLLPEIFYWARSCCARPDKDEKIDPMK